MLASSSFAVPDEPERPRPSVKLTTDESATHARALNAAAEFRRSEAELMEAVIAVGATKVFLKMGYPSLFKYAVDALKLSEAVAYNAIAVARKASEVPALREAIGSGALGFSKARKVLSVLNPRATPAEQGEWVGKAVSLSSRKLERTVAMENPRAAIAERATYRSGDRVELTFGLSEDLLLEFRQAQNLVLSGRAGAASLETTLAEVVRFYLERKDPERRARRIIAKKGSTSPAAAPVPEQVRDERFTGTARMDEAAPKTAEQPVRQVRALSVGKPEKTFVREPIRAEVAHRVRHRDQNQCQARLPDGKKCGSRRWLEIHHRIPVSEGGRNEFANLATLCRAHHQAQHQAYHQDRHQGHHQAHD